MRSRFLTCMIALALSAACSSQSSPETAAPSRDAAPQAPATAPERPATGDAAAAAPARYDGPLPPMPMPGYEAPRPPETVRAVYEFAARRPDVLHYVPCFCGCERSGHVGNDDCFIRGRDASGKPEWDLHGYS